MLSLAILVFIAGIVGKVVTLAVSNPQVGAWTPLSAGIALADVPGNTGAEQGIDSGTGEAGCGSGAAGSGGSAGGGGGGDGDGC